MFDFNKGMVIGATLLTLGNSITKPQEQNLADQLGHYQGTLQEQTVNQIGRNIDIGIKIATESNSLTTKK
jgi:hypothetical protein